MGDGLWRSMLVPVLLLSYRLGCCSSWKADIYPLFSIPCFMDILLQGVYLYKMKSTCRSEVH
jgi:hypothetical protein